MSRLDVLGVVGWHLDICRLVDCCFAGNNEYIIIAVSLVLKTHVHQFCRRRRATSRLGSA